MIGDVHCADCLDALGGLAEQSVDLVFADLPYGQTRNDWDRPIALDALWTHLERVTKPRAPMVFTAQQPFTAALVSSARKWFRYEMIWRKNKPRGFLNARRQPLRIHENILVFYREQPFYEPQMTHGHSPVHAFATRTSGKNYGSVAPRPGGGSTSRYPTSVLDIPVLNNDDPERVNPTQKPIALPAWFIRTYTKPGDVVLDPTAGSGSTLLAAKALDRRYVGYEIDPEMVAHVRRKLAATPSSGDSEEGGKSQ